MTILLTVLITLSVVAAAIAGLCYWARDDIARQQAHHDAQLRTWRIQQTEYDTEQRLRDATRAAMTDMIAEARRATHPDA